MATILRRWPGKIALPNPPKRPQAPQRRSTPTDPAAAARQRRLLCTDRRLGRRRARDRARDHLPRRRRRERRRASRARGCRLHAAELPGAAEQVRPLGRADADDEAEMELLAADERAALRQARHLGLLRRRAGPARAERAQPRARRRRDPLRPRRPEAEVDALRTWYNDTDDPNGLIIAPLATNADKITLSAWTAPDASIARRAIAATAGSRPARSSTRARSRPSSRSTATRARSASRPSS